MISKTELDKWDEYLNQVEEFINIWMQWTGKNDNITIKEDPYTRSLKAEFFHKKNKTAFAYIVDTLGYGKFVKLSVGIYKYKPRLPRTWPTEIRDPSPQDAAVFICSLYQRFYSPSGADKALIKYLTGDK